MPVKVFAALGAGWYAEKSVLSSGKWVRIKVRGSGMHQVTDSELREMGFADPGKVTVYGYPATMLADNMLTDNIPDDLPPLPFARYGDKLVFYAEGDVSLHVSRHRQPDGSGKDFTKVKRNYFADYGIYFRMNHPGRQQRQCRMGWRISRRSFRTLAPSGHVISGLIVLPQGVAAGKSKCPDSMVTG